MDKIRRGADNGIGDRHLLKPDNHIYDLADVIHKENMGAGQILNQREGDKIIYDLVDIVEDVEERPDIDDKFHDEMMQRISSIAEKIARDIIPDIAERVIREEIEKLKKDE
jgi:hypothetical protein